MKNHFKKKKRNKGFSLIEVIVSIGIISIGIIPILNLFSSLLRNETDNRNKLIALYLAEENIEVMRQLRDNDVLGENVWQKFLKGSPAHRTIVLDCGSSCGLDDGWIIHNTGGNVEFNKVFYDTEEKYYGQRDPITSGVPDNWQDTGFKRWMKMEDKSAIEPVENENDEDNAMKITIYVSYADEILAEISTYLYNWQ